MDPTPELYPAIDLRGGRVVRLREGDFADETVYGDDPVAVATSFCEQGARWVHVVDLDAARTGEPRNRHLVAAIASAVAGRARVQVGGGVRRPADAAALAGVGIARVVMGSAALGRPALVDEVASIIPVAVGLDHRAGELSVHGWTRSAGVSLAEAVTRFERATAFVITDIERDGILGGPDVAGLEAAAAATAVPVIASGGVGTLDDVRALAGIARLGGIIVGRALYEGRFTVGEALAVIASSAASGAPS